MNQAIQTILNSAVAAKTFPGASVAVIKDDAVMFVNAGRTTYNELAPAITEQTVYDIASVTKSIPVSSLILWLIEQNKLTLDTKAMEYVPELQNTYRDQITLRHLLSYTVIFDLPQGLAFHGKQGAEAVMQAIFTAPLLAPPGERYYYTNTPALLLGLVAERCTGKTLDVLAREVFFEPLGMTNTSFFPERLQQVTIAPTEEDWRGLVHGAVHDEAAWALRASNIIAGNAGLFSTTADLSVFCRMLLQQGTFAQRHYFKPETIQQMYTNQVASLKESAGLGWELHQPRFMGNNASSSCFGKIGFTGAIVLIDPIKQAALVLLSNRIHPKRPADRDAIHAVRRAVADIVFA